MPVVRSGEGTLFPHSSPGSRGKVRLLELFLNYLMYQLWYFDPFTPSTKEPCGGRLGWNLALYTAAHDL
ncbi:hypothetical protein PDESU_05964 [Pontiella desulfatans]|uniref:Uncharacterized protein n=1 Tax=Pontiella desulfatans TaxID=2750659 RepID=A0A6C2UB46_PONDE|nr:hypothetical protein PDESU_05964 [Pontiella desulfatans]